ncbi:adenosine deaminase [Pseudonocardia hierapolitana]|uniref:Adenosine deaminase n=1 Tax=Pseudonocardia hierapolitana TaxID=1128676 RepID=A0A561SLN6_9PSEU|nr:adenosine deaminase [Pseudonocardia hierapolitana]TWF75794.1 adenosine deaminase [Pseudonocardia hierapolitana]
MPRDLRQLPKAHLHLHLEGAMRPSTLAELAAEAGVPTPPIRGYTSFGEFGLQYRAASALIETEAHLRRVVREVVDDAADDGAVWVEPHFYPPRYAGTLGAVEEVLEIVIDEGERAAAARGIGCGWIVSALRDFEVAQAVDLAQLAAKYAGSGVVAFGLAADEALFPPEPFAEAFAIARDAGLISAPHAGELAGPASVYGALDALGARRICHGVRALEDPALVERLAADEVVLDVCPTSNVMLAVVPSIEEHPLVKLLEAGVRCSLNGDDPLLFGPGLLAEYELVRDTMGLSDEQLAQLARSSLVGSGAPPELIADAADQVEDWLTAAA